MLLKTPSLTPEVLQIVHHKGTEYPFTGEYENWDKPGSYLCRQCGVVLFRSQSKFHAGCGWPSFDEEIPGTVHYQRDADGQRTEILCQRCEAHLGHVFKGEQFTAKNIRHCVNSASLDFVPDLMVLDTEEAIFAAGCFWGVEYYFQKLPGVLKTEVGYTGGIQAHPTYQEVCAGDTGHYEAIRVIFDSTIMTYNKLTQYFFEIHDFSQPDGQGPDIGQQYLSAIFYYDDSQKNIAENLIKQLQERNYSVATKLLPVSTFWRAENYHQDYYAKNGKEPYCHFYQKKFT